MSATIIPEMDQKLARELQKVGDAFNLAGPFFSFEEIYQGNVNETYRVNYIRDDGTGMAVIKPYLFQKVNTYAFKRPVELMENIDKITEYIHAKRPKQTCLHYRYLEDSENRQLYLEDEDSFWRICNYVPSVTFDTVDDLHVVQSAGEAFGDFQMMLSDFNAEELYYTIPDFHNTVKRYETFEADVKADPCGRVAEVQKEIDWLLSVKDQACKLTRLQKEGKLPLRVTHNDTKINNVLFDKETHNALVVIDLDTSMPGLVGHDFGDAIRFAANFVQEDSPEFEKAGVDLNVFWAFAEGFLSKTVDTLTDLEIDTLGLSCFSLACELATRFLDDYITGDKYFKTDYDGHNLVRTRCQIALAQDMEKKMEAMSAIIRGCVEKHRNKKADQ